MKRFSKALLLIIATISTIISLSQCTVAEDGIYGAFPFLNVSMTDTLLSKYEQTVSITVETNRKITAESDATWLRATTEGNNVILSAQKNTNEHQRSANVEIKTFNSTYSATITVTQDASGELTIHGDLILRNSSEIRDNSYTIVEGNLILGNIINQSGQAATSQDGLTTVIPSVMDNPNYTIILTFDGKSYEFDASDISDKDIAVLNDKLSSVHGNVLAIANTKVASFPYDLAYKHGMKTIFLSACELTELPTAEQMRDLDPTELFLGYNDLTDISSINGLPNLINLGIQWNEIEDISTIGTNKNIEILNIGDNNIHNIDPVLELPKLRKLSLRYLPIQRSQYEVFSERLSPNCTVDTTGLKYNESPLMYLESPVEITHDETSLTLSSKITRNQTTDISNPGFYFGSSKLMDKMSFVEGTLDATEGTISAIISDVDVNNNVYFFRAYAENSIGKSYSPISKFGDVIVSGYYFIKNEDEFKAFYDEIVTQVNGSLYIGNTVAYSSTNRITVPGDTLIYFDESTISDLIYLDNLSYVENGLYIVHTDVEKVDIISNIEHIRTLWLEGNRIQTVPDFSNIAELKTINLARNNISEYSNILKLGNIDTLYLGNSAYPYYETNNIANLKGLETLTNLKYLDLSGLPLHTWQVDELMEAMPNCEIVYVAGNRTPFLPTLESYSCSIIDNKVTMKGYLTDKGAGAITEYGFYWGKDINSLTKAVVGTDDIANGTLFTYEIEVGDEDVYYYIPYAVNTFGESKSMDTKKFTTSTIDLSANGTANTYIVSNSGRYSFNPHIIGNGQKGIISADFHTDLAEINPVSAELLWESKSGMITNVEYRAYEKDVVFTSDGEEGNAVIVVKDDSGTIIWSWHIWCTDKPSDQRYVNRSGESFMVMDRNLGATRADRGTGDQWKEAIGTGYQWGRKDPIVQNHYEVSDTESTIENSISHPNTYYTADNGWMEPMVREAWSPNVKTIYDPCPAGYRVATKDIWTNFIIDNSYYYTYDYSQFNIIGEYNNGFDFVIDGTNSSYYPATMHGWWSTEIYPNLGRYWSANSVNETDHKRGSALNFDINESYLSVDLYWNIGALKCVRCIKISERETEGGNEGITEEDQYEW